MADYTFIRSQTETVIYDPKVVKFLEVYNPGQAPSCRIALNFKCKLNKQYWDVPYDNIAQDGLEIYSEEIQSLLGVSISFEILGTDKSDKGKYLAFREFLLENLMKAYPIPEDDSQEIIGAFIKKLETMFIDVPNLTKKSLSLTFPIDIELIHIYERVSDEISRYSYMIPTSDAAIKSLKRKRMEEYEDGAKINIQCCMICLEKIERKSQLCELQCSHIYHEDCTIQWLNTSHYCPVCRFEMPV